MAERRGKQTDSEDIKRVPFIPETNKQVISDIVNYNVDFVCLLSSEKLYP